MRYAAIAVAAAVSLASAATADTVPVRAGTHQEFTRLVFDFGSFGSWQVSSAERAISVQATNDKVVFDAAAVFRSIPRGRVEDIAVPPEGPLTIQLGCTCGYRAFGLPGGRLVIDISEAYFEAPQPEVGEIAVQPSRPDTDASPMGPAIFAGTHRDDDRAQLQSALAVWPVQPDMDVPANATPRQPTGRSTDKAIFAAEVGRLGLPRSLDPAAQDRLSDTRDALLKQFQRAAVQGLIQPPTPELPAANAPSEATDATAMLPEPEVIVREQAHMTVETAADRSTLQAAVQEFARLTASECLPDSYFDISAWGDSKASPPGLSGLRAHLVQEFDQADEARILELARRYLFLGFGAEARAVLSAFQVENETAVILKEIATLIDDIPQSAPNTATQLNCSGPAAMWSILARGELTEPFDDPSAVLRTFSSLPPHLRALLGPRISLAFLDAGQPDTAVTLQAMVARAPDADDEALGLMNARVQLAKGQDLAASTNLEAVVAADGPQAAIALAELIEIRAESGQPIEAPLAQAADALAVEYRGTEIGRRLVKAAIRAFSVAGQPELTFSHIDRAIGNGSLNAEEAVLLRAEAHLNSAENADDIPFLLVAHRHPFLAAPQDPLEIDARRAVAARLLDLGFADQASKTMLPVEETWEAVDHVLAARLALARGDPATALAQVGELTGTEADQLRAVALARQGESAAAVSAAIASGQSLMAERLAWRAGDLGAVLDHGDEVLDAAAKLALETDADRGSSQDQLGIGDPDGTPLEAGRDMLARSARIRDTFSNLITNNR